MLDPVNLIESLNFIEKFTWHNITRDFKLIIYTLLED